MKTGQGQDPASKVATNGFSPRDGILSLARRLRQSAPGTFADGAESAAALMFMGAEVIEQLLDRVELREDRDDEDDDRPPKRRKRPVTATAPRGDRTQPACAGENRKKHRFDPTTGVCKFCPFANPRHAPSAVDPAGTTP